MPLNKNKIIKKISVIIILLLLVLLLIVGIKGSNFGNIKKYDSSTKSGFGNAKFSSSRTGSQRVTILGNNVANLGEFTFNISNNRMLIADISLKYKSKKDDSWFADEDKIEKEFLMKSAILRDTTINTILGNSIESADSDKLRNSLQESLNGKLSNGEVVEVYFNKFIIQ